MKKLSIAIAAIAAGFMGMSSAQAYEAGDMILRVGAASVNPEDESDEAKIGGTDVADILGVSSVTVSADDNIQIGITGTYMLTPNWGIELLAATPFSHDVDLVVDGSGEKLGSIKHLPPTLSLQYYFMGSGSKFQPYVGVGLNYTLFFSEELTGDAEDAGFSNLKLDDSIGLAVEAGFDYAIDEHWLINAAVWKIDIGTTAEVDLAGSTVEVDYDLDPWAFMVGVGYKF